MELEEASVVTLVLDKAMQTFLVGIKRLGSRHSLLTALVKMQLESRQSAVKQHVGKEAFS